MVTLRLPEKLMGAAPTWRDAHPAGLALKARLKTAQGLHEEAHRLQLLALARHRLPPHPAQTVLLDVYERAAMLPKGSPAVTIPVLPRLLCATFVSRQREVKSAEALAT